MLLSACCQCMYNCAYTHSHLHKYMCTRVCVCVRAPGQRQQPRRFAQLALSQTHTHNTYTAHTHFIRSSTDCIYQILLQFCCCYSFLYSTIFKQLIAAQPAWTAQQQTRLQLFFLFILCIINLAFVCVVCVVCMCD